MLLAQATGRLIRSETDRGVLLVCDEDGWLVLRRPAGND